MNADHRAASVNSKRMWFSMIKIEIFVFLALYAHYYNDVCENRLQKNVFKYASNRVGCLATMLAM